MTDTIRVCVVLLLHPGQKQLNRRLVPFNAYGSSAWAHAAHAVAGL